jgi:hypothetical protein
MGWLWKPKTGGPWDLASVERPWRQDIPSIYAHITAHISPGMKGLTEGGARLPDEKDDGGLKWAAGGLDGAFGHHGGGRSDKSRRAMLYRAIGVVLEDASALKLGKLYDQLMDDGVLDFIDPLLARISETRDLDAKRLEELATWLVRNAPARIDRVVALAEQVLTLDAIATGPAREIGIGRAWASHRHLDFVLQDLRRWPGKGWPLIHAGMRSPVSGAVTWR